jgi:hypothetical protein
MRFILYRYYNFRNNSVSPVNQLLICIRYYATGCHQLTLQYFSGMHKSTINRIVKRVTEAICATLSQEITSFPEGNENIISIMQGFYQLRQFPNVNGAIDCTHINIVSPGRDDAEIFRNRKKYFSVNVQAVADHNYRFKNLVARWPGSTHDVTIFNNSQLKASVHNDRNPNFYLLGNNGYALKPYLLTPLLEPRNQAERRYNNSHKRTRVIIENTFGIWKRRFPILAYGCRTKLSLTLDIIVATAVLHNIARNANSDEPELPVVCICSS